MVHPKRWPLLRLWWMLTSIGHQLKYQSPEIGLIATITLVKALINLAVRVTLAPSTLYIFSQLPMIKTQESPKQFLENSSNGVKLFITLALLSFLKIFQKVNWKKTKESKGKRMDWATHSIMPFIYSSMWLLVFRRGKVIALECYRLLMLIFIPIIWTTFVLAMEFQHMAEFNHCIDLCLNGLMRNMTRKKSLRMLFWWEFVKLGLTSWGTCLDFLIAFIMSVWWWAPII